MSFYGATENFYGQDMAEHENLQVWAEENAPETSGFMREVALYFQSKKNNRSFNRRSDLVPSELRSFLPYFTLLDCQMEDSPAGPVFVDAKFRLVGTKMAGLYGEATGKLVSEHHGLEALERVRKIAEYCIENRTMAVGRSSALSQGRPFLDVTVLYVPFADEDDAAVTQFLVFSDILRLELQAKI